MMKKSLFLMCLIFCSAFALSDEGVINLLQPNLNREGTVMQALLERKSTREFSARELDLQDVSDLLWAANGVNRAESGKRTAPSALNRQDIDVYVIMGKGAYLYNAQKHCLVLIADGDFRALVAGGQDFVKQAPLSLVLVSETQKMGDLSDSRTLQMCAVDAGIVSQNISIFCASVNLATVARASMDAKRLSEVLKLTATQIPLMNHPIGYFKER
jgi:SagB-type dehydrogenase family enzyme